MFLCNLYRLTQQKVYDFATPVIELPHRGASSAHAQNNVSYTQHWHLLGSSLAVIPVDTIVPNAMSEMLSGQAVVQRRGRAQWRPGKGKRKGKDSLCLASFIGSDLAMGAQTVRAKKAVVRGMGIPVVPALGRTREEEFEFQVRYIV